MILLYVLLSVSVLLNLVAAAVLYRIVKKLFQFDELFELMADEVNINIGFFEKLLKKPLFMASPEIEEANNNMNLMMIRFKEFVSQMSELSGKDLSENRLPQKSVSPRPPVVVD